MALPELLQDLRYTIRVLRREAGFAAFAILIAGLGIGASVTVFSVVHTLILRPLPFAEPDRLVWIANRDTAGSRGRPPRWATCSISGNAPSRSRPSQDSSPSTASATTS